MPPSDWAHVITSTRGHWLPGDPRGFRSRNHRIHSSGNYKNPPPKGEHEGLHRFSASIAADAVRLNNPQIKIAGEAILTKLRSMRIPVAALAVDAVHVHALIRVDDQDAVKLLGRAKQAASHALRSDIPGRIWGRSSHVVRAKDRAHGTAIKNYIARHAEEGAWVYLHDQPEPSAPRRDASDPASPTRRRH